MPKGKNSTGFLSQRQKNGTGFLCHMPILSDFGGFRGQMPPNKCIFPAKVGQSAYLAIIFRRYLRRMEIVFCLRIIRISL